MQRSEKLKKARSKDYLQNNGHVRMAIGEEVKRVQRVADAEAFLSDKESAFARIVTPKQRSEK